MPQWPLAPAWAVEAGTLGRTLVIVGLVAFLASIVGWAVGKADNEHAATFGKRAFVVGALCLFGTILCLGSLFATDQFEYNYVFGHGDANTELRYKIAGIWSGQQGSFLLWGCTSSIFGILAARGAREYRRWFTIIYATFLATLCGILAYETPFELSKLGGKIVQPNIGAGLQPSLQNYWVVIHPPTIFMGFGSLTVAFAFGLAAMLKGNLKDWVPLARPWALVSTAVLGLGLCMGGFWAYETLGWGGFWMWDPVENVSFVPWIFSAALLHGMIVQVARNRWHVANLVLAGLPFVTFCYGTFLTRSGFLADASVHSFAEMNRSALWILGLFVVLAALTYYGVLLFKGRKLAAAIPNQQPMTGLQREGLYSSGVLLLSGLSAAVAIGMSIPFFLAIAHRNSKVVDEPLYHQVVVWFFLPILVLMAVAPFIGWRSLGLAAYGRRVSNVFAITLGIVGLLLIAFKTSLFGIEISPGGGDNPMLTMPDVIQFPGNHTVPVLPWMMVLISVCVLCAVGNTWRLIETWRRAKMSVGGFVAHIGLAVLMAGLIISRGFERKEQVVLSEGDIVKALDYTISYLGMSRSDEGGLFLRDNKVLFEVTGPGGSFTARPGLYYIRNSEQQLSPMVWPHLEHNLTHDIYFTLHPPQLDVWKDPIPFAPGDTKRPEDGPIEVSYRGFKMSGQGGQAGTKFVADVVVSIQDKAGSWHAHTVHPSIELTADGLQPNFAQIDASYMISMDSINASDHSALLQLHFTRPIYPIDVFYKPMVILVWLGAGIMTAGGLLAAFYRRPLAKSGGTGVPAIEIRSELEKEDV